MLMPAHDSAKSTGFGIMVTSLDLLRDHQKFIHTLWFMFDIICSWILALSQYEYSFWNE
ncbi:unnamed protein product [Arabidopsis thaliana]|uniref:(thale cress) hypothetical protein n=1 Tax=Arabidopsis thaliana TaxID=3702 RepID=A0A7G2EQM4_ARATH|nr:unnamed protein product [Arabidopsis thaliana]